MKATVSCTCGRPDASSTLSQILRQIPDVAAVRSIDIMRNNLESVYLSLTGETGSAGEAEHAAEGVG